MDVPAHALAAAIIQRREIKGMTPPVSGQKIDTELKRLRKPGRHIIARAGQAALHEILLSGHLQERRQGSRLDYLRLDLDRFPKRPGIAYAVVNRLLEKAKGEVRVVTEDIHLESFYTEKLGFDLTNREGQTHYEGPEYATDADAIRRRITAAPEWSRLVRQAVCS